MAFSYGVEVADGMGEVPDALVESDHPEIFPGDEEEMDRHPVVYQGGVRETVPLPELSLDDDAGIG